MGMETYEKYSDEQLVAFMRVGDQSAFAEIFQRYHTSIYLFVLRRLNDLVESEDLVSDLFISIWSKHGDFCLKGSLASYLYTAARNRIYNIIAHNKIKERYIDSFRDYFEMGINDTDHLVRSRELTELINKEVDSLPTKMREVFLLSRRTYLSQKEIAERLGITEVTVKSHMNHALKILRARLGAFFFTLFF